MCAIMDLNRKEDLSTSSFQQKIFDWFDRRGMLSELRSHLRHQMISAFQSSSISNMNSSGRFTVESPISPALQAFLLLVAEFLAQQEYHYTVSILVAEVPLLATFPKFSALVSHLSDSQHSLQNKDLPRYSEKDVLDILDTLGIARNSESCYHILRLYMDSAPRESLLACILTALPAVANDHSKSSETDLDKQPENLTYYVEEIRLLLLRAQLDKNQLHQLEDVLGRFHASASAKARLEERALCLKEAETNNQQLREWENAARIRQRNVEVELEASKRQLKAVTSQLRVQHNDVLRRLRRVQKHAEEVRLKEKQVEAAKYENEELRKHLESRNEKLVGQQARLEEGLRSLQEERDNLLVTRAEIQSALQREKAYVSSINEQKQVCANLQNELEQTRLELTEVRLQLRASTQNKIQPMVEPSCERGAEKEVASRYTQTEIAESSSSSSSVVEPAPSCSSCDVDPGQIQSGAKKVGDRQVGLGTVNIVRHLRQENAELQERNLQLQRRLEEVTEQAAIWASSPSRLVEAAALPRPTIAAPSPPTPPPLPPAPLLRKVARSCELGAGEELSHPPVRTASSSRDHRLHLHGREWKRTAPKQLLVHVESSEYPSSDESVSEEVLRETGRRLRHLDAESELIDRRRKELKESALTNTTSYMFIPTTATPKLPPPPTARAYEPGSITARLSLFPPAKLSSSFNFGLHDSTLGRYSQVTWPDVQGTSTPIRSLDNPLRRGARSHLSVSRERRTTVASAESARHSEERVSTSPLRSAERNASLRLDAALDNIKLIREDLRRRPEHLGQTMADETKDRSTPWDSVRSVPNEDSIVFHPDAVLDSPSRIRDRVMATLRASTSAVASLSAFPLPSGSSSQAAQHSVQATQPTVQASRQSEMVTQQSARVPEQSAQVPQHHVQATQHSAQATNHSLPGSQHTVQATLVDRETVELPVQVLVETELEEEPGTALPYRISSTAVPKLPLAPPVISEKTEESPKDSTLNEISTPASSPSMSGKLESLRKIARKVNLADAGTEQKNSTSSTDKHGILVETVDTEVGNSKSNSKSIGHARGAAEVVPLKSEIQAHRDVLDGNGNLSPQRNYQVPTTAAGPIANTNDSSQPSNWVFEKDDQVLDLNSSSGEISAGSADEDLKDDSW